MENKIAVDTKVYYYNGILKVKGIVIQSNKANIRIKTDLGQIVKLPKEKVHEDK